MDTSSTLVLTVSAVVALVWAWTSRTLAAALLLQPTAQNLAPGSPEPVEFRYVRFAQITVGTWSPRGLLAVLLFAAIALAARVVLEPTGDWRVFLRQLSWWICGGVVVFGGRGIGLLVILAVPASVIGAAGDNTPASYGVGLGIFFGCLAGVVAGLNVALLVHDTWREASGGRKRDGTPISWLARAGRAGSGFLLLGVPIAILYEAVRFWLPGIDFRPVLTASLAPHIGEAYGRATSAIALLLVGLNVAFFAIPMFVETLERGSLMSAAGFVDARLRVEARRAELARTGAQPTESDKSDEHFLGQYLGEKGEWLVAGGMSTLPILVITLLFLANGIGKLLECLIGLAWLEPDPAYDGLGVILGWIGFFSNATALLMMLVHFPFGARVRDAAGAIWDATGSPGVRLHFVGTPGSLRVARAPSTPTLISA